MIILKGWKKMSFHHISVTELAALKQKDEELTVLDIRDPESFAAGHIQDAVHLTNSNAKEVLNNLSPTAKLVVCCYHGHSSQPASEWIAEQGFSPVFSLDGGYTEWALTYQ